MKGLTSRSIYQTFHTIIFTLRSPIMPFLCHRLKGISQSCILELPHFRRFFSLSQFFSRPGGAVPPIFYANEASSLPCGCVCLHRCVPVCGWLAVPSSWFQWLSESLSSCHLAPLLIPATKDHYPGLRRGPGHGPRRGPGPGAKPNPKS